MSRQGEARIHIELVASIGIDVLPDERRERALIDGGKATLPMRSREDLLHHQRVDEHEW